LEELRYGAILHDIGKIHVQETTLCKEGPLNPEEWNEIRQHPANGAVMVGDIPYLVPAIPAIKHHHEQWNGDGYPDGLVGENIPIMARIVTVGDAFDAMTTTRAYQTARSINTAFDDIRQGSGIYYDPTVVATFTRAWESGEIQKVAEGVHALPM
jgi:HD-GYP domain-containing protein (c-di-GMP phosphodiesterase class II)